jgi:hypothetical protein
MQAAPAVALLATMDTRTHVHALVDRLPPVQLAARQTLL